MHKNKCASIKHRSCHQCYYQQNIQWIIYDHMIRAARQSQYHNQCEYHNFWPVL